MGLESEIYVAPRKVKIVDDELLFDWEEVNVDYKYGEDVIASREDVAIDDILSYYRASDVKKCLESILKYMHNDEVIELNNESKEN